MPSRRAFLETTLAGMAVSGLAQAAAPTASPPKRLAVITTEWRYHSHAWHMAERFLVGYPHHGRWHHPPLKVVGAYVDQTPETDLSRQRAREFGFPIYPSIAETVRCGGNELAVDAVLIIGEHGNYAKNEFEQTKYPRYEFFKQVTAVFRQEGKSVPIFNDKHLSWKWEWAKEMFDTARELKFAFAAGSSLPVTWRMPAVDLPHGAEVEELLCVAFGGIDSYDFHAYEVLQCMAERRRGGETGVAAVQALRGDAVWKAFDADRWETGGWNPQLFEACLSRCQTLAQPETFSHRYPTAEQMRAWVKDPLAFRIEYRDGLKATLLMLNGLVRDFTFAAKLTGKAQPLSTLFYLPPNPNVTYSAELMSKAEETFLTGKSPTRLERTLLTTGLVEAGVRSLSRQERIETPHLKIEYHVGLESTYARE